jgi:hypothetical protein
MAELAALGVASCILQVVDFGSRVIKTTCILISASQDALREEIHLEKLVREQDGVAQRLASSLKCRPVLTANEQAVVSLSGEVKKETDDLLRLLSQFKVASVDQNNGQLATALLSVQRYNSRRMPCSKLHWKLTCSFQGSTRSHD